MKTKAPETDRLTASWNYAILMQISTTVSKHVESKRRSKHTKRRGIKISQLPLLNKFAALIYNTFPKGICGLDLLYHAVVPPVWWSMASISSPSSISSCKQKMQFRWMNSLQKNVISQECKSVQVRRERKHRKSEFIRSLLTLEGSNKNATVTFMYFSAWIDCEDVNSCMLCVSVWEREREMESWPRLESAPLGGDDHQTRKQLS